MQVAHDGTQKQLRRHLGRPFFGTLRTLVLSKKCGNRLALKDDRI